MNSELISFIIIFLLILIFILSLVLVCMFSDLLTYLYVIYHDFDEIYRKLIKKF